MTDQNDFGWIDEGSHSTECMYASRQALRRTWPVLLVALVLLCTLAPGAGAAAASERVTINSEALVIVAAMAAGGALGVLVGLAIAAAATAPTSAQRCRLCGSLPAPEHGLQHEPTPARRVRAGAPPPLPASYSSEHPDWTLAGRRVREGKRSEDQ